MSPSITSRKPGSALSSSLQVTLVWGQLAAMLEGRDAIWKGQEPTAVQQGEVQSATPGREEPLYGPRLGPTAREQLWEQEKSLWALAGRKPSTSQWCFALASLLALTMVYSVSSLPLEYLTLKPYFSSSFIK